MNWQYFSRRLLKRDYWWRRFNDGAGGAGGAAMEMVAVTFSLAGISIVLVVISNEISRVASELKRHNDREERKGGK